MTPFVAELVPPPVDMSAPDGPALFFTVFVGAFFVGLTAWALSVAVRERNVLPIILLASGIIASGIEPILDVLGLVYYPADSPVIAFTALGRPIPSYAVMGYGFYFGIGSYLMYRLLRRGVTLKRLLVICALVELADVCFEVPGVALGVYRYYTGQPFEVLGFPLWWGSINSLMPLAGGAALLYLVPLLRGWRKLGLLWMVPTLYAAINGAIAWPMWLALSSSLSYGAKSLVALVTMGTGWTLAFLIARAVARPQPAADVGAQRGAAGHAAERTAGPVGVASG